MTAEQFAYWLNGFVELGNGSAPTPEQWKSIREHLETVFKKVTPPVGNEPKAVESDLARSLREFAERQAKYPHQHQIFPQQTFPQQTFPYYPPPPINPMVVTC